MQTKVVIFDFDGTLTISKSSTWARIWQKVDAVDLDYELYKMYHRGEIDYNTWLSRGAEEIGKRGYTLSNLKELACSMVLIQDIEQVFCYLKENGVKIYILSGGIKTLIKEKLSNLKKYVTHIEAPDFVFDKDENLVGSITPNHNPENKQEFVRIIIEKEGVLPDEVLFVGNGKNDESVYKTKVNTLCLNHDDADYTNKEIWHNSIETKTLLDILPYITCKNKNNSV